MDGKMPTMKLIPCILALYQHVNKAVFMEDAQILIHVLAVSDGKEMTVIHVLPCLDVLMANAMAQHWAVFVIILINGLAVFATYLCVMVAQMVTVLLLANANVTQDGRVSTALLALL